MKTLFKRKAFVIPLIVAAMTLLIAGTVYAATALTVPGNVTVVAATCDIEVYSDAACTVKLEKVVWNELPQGGERAKTVYIKNVGNSDALVTATLHSAPDGVTLTEDTVTVARGESAPFELTLKASPKAVLGVASSSFTIEFSSIVVP